MTAPHNEIRTHLKAVALKKQGGRRAIDESGQVFAILVVAIIVLLGMGAFVIDAGSWYHKDRQAQAAADAGALAAAWELPDNPPGAETTGTEYVAKNLSEASATVVPGYGADPNKVEVAVTAPAPGFFAKIFGIDSVDVHARAVAQVTYETGPLAIFNYRSDCSEALGLKHNGDDLTIEGAIHSNGGMWIGGNDINVSSATYGWTSSCEPVLGGTPMDFGGSSTPAYSGWRDWPFVFDPSSAPCTHTAPSYAFTQEGEEIPAGVYCTQRFEVNGKRQFGTFTVIADEIKINGEEQNFAPFYTPAGASMGLLFFSTGTADMILDGRNYNWSGIIAHYDGRVKINGDASSVYEGLIAAQTVKMNGQGLRIYGAEGYDVKRVILLVE